LNAKLDLGDETEKCHGLTTSASREKDYKRAKCLQVKPMETVKQALQNT